MKWVSGEGGASVGRALRLQETLCSPPGVNCLVHVRACMYMNVCTYTYMHMCARMHAYACVPVHGCVCVYKHMYVYMCVCMYTHVHTHV